jgi:hypothetical protein
MYIFGRKIHLIVYAIESTLRINLKKFHSTNINKM